MKPDCLVKGCTAAATRVLAVGDVHRYWVCAGHEAAWFTSRSRGIGNDMRRADPGQATFTGLLVLERWAEHESQALLSERERSALAAAGTGYVPSSS